VTREWRWEMKKQENSGAGCGERRPCGTGRRRWDDIMFGLMINQTNGDGNEAQLREK
jgi:hypothetical protein